ncbi:hypothetical protein [Terracidiphilus gabretensis]|uniref:hypothetical protein n=1 Tax=Terracidiphilus gabretensis TaxID=1577687 RepID=UPI00071BC9F2|nr:hypothetical protein [Terracidiphilus gabretensis]
MPIFGRRQLQQMLNELGPWLVRSKATDLLKRLENVSADQAIPAEFELALSWALTKVARLEIDRPMGNRTPDIYSPDLLSSAPVSVDVAAISDALLSGQAFMRRAAKIINRTCDEILTGSSAHLHYTFQERSGYVRDEFGRTRFDRRRLITKSFQMDPQLRLALAAWLKNRSTDHPLHWAGKDIKVTISWRDYVHPQSNTFCTMPSLAYDLRENPLYQVLKSKSDQLQNVSNGAHRGVFLGDAGCQLFNDIYRVDRVNNTFSGQQVIETFLADESTIDFVAVFSVKRAMTGSRDSSKNPRIWHLYVFEQKSQKNLDLSCLMHLRDILPAPYLSGYEARSWHEQGMFSAQARGRYLPTSMSIGKQSMTVRISGRALQELMAGRLTVKEFENWTVGGRPNPFEQQLALGWTISSVSYEPKDASADDDYLIFTFKDDPAAAALRLPDELRIKDAK